MLKSHCCCLKKQEVRSWSKTASVCHKSKEKYSTRLSFFFFTVPTLHYVVLSLQPCFAVDWGEDKIKATAAISSLLAPWQIGPLSNRGLIYQAKDGYWNCPTGHKSEQWIGLYLRQGRHHSVVAGRGGTRPFKSLSCVFLADGCGLLDLPVTRSRWTRAKPVLNPDHYRGCARALDSLSRRSSRLALTLLFFPILPRLCCLFFHLLRYR